MLKVLDLFSGIGGFSLGLERTGGFQTVAFCEIDPFCRRVLAKHWPGVPCYDDIKTLTAGRLRDDGIEADVICGGFPCQDLSYAGKGAGLAGERSGLWREYAQLIGEIRPRYVLVENVAALLGRGLGEVLGDLAALGYDAEWHCIPASYVGAPHRRDRVWIVAHAAGVQRDGGEHYCGGSCERSGTGEAIPQPGNGGCDEDMANPNRPRLALRLGQRCDPRAEQSAVVGGGWWQSEPDVGRVAHGVSARVDRLKALGNAVVPQIPELIGRAIMEATP